MKNIDNSRPYCWISGTTPWLSFYAVLSSLVYSIYNVLILSHIYAKHSLYFPSFLPTY